MSQIERGPGSFFRLVVQLEDREAVYPATPLRGYKQALAHVAAAVRAHAALGRPRAVRLQRAANDGDGAGGRSGGREPDGLRWLDFERWDGPVVARILGQNGVPAASPAAGAGAVPEARTLEDAPQPAGGVRVAPVGVQSAGSREASAAGCAAAVFQPPPARRAGWPRRAEGVAAATRLRSRRWYLGAAGAIVAVAWMLVLLALTGGRPQLLLRVTRGLSQRPPTQEIPFDGPLDAGDRP